MEPELKPKGCCTGQALAIVLILLVAVVLAVFIVTYDWDGGEEASSDPVQPEAVEQVRLVTWNLYNFGQSKDAGEIAFMADLLRDYDVVAIQEVSTGPAGPDAVARLADALSRTGFAWDYAVSDPTSGEGSERYAYLWKPSRVQLQGRPWLEPSLADPIDREPYMARFRAGPSGRTFLAASLHAVPTAKRPADEVVLLDDLTRLYPDDHLLIFGDFNLAESHYAFDELKAAGFAPVLVDQPTSLRRQRRDGRHLANEYDNIFYEPGELRPARSGVIDFTTGFPTLKEARTISDHLPVYMEVAWE